MEHGPDYCCALIERADGWLLLELRPGTRRWAPDQLVCFGGRREDGEGEIPCLLRELDEELGWRPAEAQPVCTLMLGPRRIARFYRASWTGPDCPRARDAGSIPIWAPWKALDGLPLSPWHRLVLAGVAQGATVVALPS